MLQLVLLAALGSGVAHAPLHPAAADVFLEIGSPKDALAARERAPFNKLFADEEMKKVYGLLEGFKVPVQAIGEAALPEALLGASSPFRAATHASFSISGLDPANAQSPEWHLGVEGILDFADAAGATSALAALEGWKAIERSTDAALAQECKLGDHACALRWYDGAGAAPVAALARAGLRKDGRPEAQRTPRFWLAQDGARLYMGAFETTPEQVSARVGGKEPGLPEESKLFAGSEAMSPSSGTPVYRLWSDVDLQGVMHAPFLADFGAQAQVLARWLLPTLLPYAGAKGVWRVEMRGERFVSEAVYQRQPGFEDKAFGIGNTDASAGRFVPKDAIGAWITNVDAKVLESEARTLVGALLAKDATIPADALQQLPTLAEGLGTHAALYLFPINNLKAPRAFLAIELKDKAKFEAALAAWAAKLAELAPEAKLTNKPYRKLTCVSLAIGKEADEAANAGGSPLGAFAPDMSLSPTIVVFEDRVLFGVRKDYAQSETRRIADGKSTELHPIANPENFPKDVFEASAMDWGGLFGKLLDIAKGLAPMAAGMMGENAPQIDAKSLPGSATLARYFKPTTSWSKRLADGRIYSYAESSFGPETPLEIALFASSAGPAMAQRAATPPPASAQPEKPAPAEPAIDKPALETDAALMRAKSGIVVFKLDQSKLPARLEDLLAASANYPEGYLAPQKELPKDGWGRALAYKPEPDGKRFLLYSFGPDGKDDGGAGDDVKAR